MVYQGIIRLRSLRKEDRHKTTLMVYQGIIRLRSLRKEDRHKTTFATEWGSYQYTVMPYGLKNVPAVLSRAVVAALKDFIHKFVEVYLDYWTVFSLLKQHVDKLRMLLDRCLKLQISLNLKKCIFCSPFGVLLGHIVCRHGLLVDSAKIAVIMNLAAPTTVRELRAKLGHTGYYRWFMKGYVLRSRRPWKSCFGNIPSLFGRPSASWNLRRSRKG